MWHRRGASGNRKARNRRTKRYDDMKTKQNRKGWHSDRWPDEDIAIEP
ncbi:unnamed protein product, partial [Ectocarpus fasciculatus]